MRRLIVFAAIGLAACTGSNQSATSTAPTAPTPTVAAVSIAGAPAAAAAAFQLSANARLSDGSTQDVTRSATWASSNAGIATVTASGLVTPVSTGDVNISATYQGMSGMAHVTITSKVYTISGVVTDSTPTGTPIADARVQDIGATYALSNAQGAFTLSGISAGLTLIEVTKQGYRTAEYEIQVSGDTQLMVTLSPAATTSGRR